MLEASGGVLERAVEAHLHAEGDALGNQESDPPEDEQRCVQGGMHAEVHALGQGKVQGSVADIEPRVIMGSDVIQRPLSSAAVEQLIAITSLSRSEADRLLDSTGDWSMN